jgi:hypothetical protein
LKKEEGTEEEIFREKSRKSRKKLEKERKKQGKKWAKLKKM